MGDLCLRHFYVLFLSGWMRSFSTLFHSWRIPTTKNQCLLFKIKTFSALQDHKSRSVQFRTCVKYVKLYASCELHRPAFMTLEPIRWQLRSWELMSILNRWLCKLSGKQMSNMADILFEKSLSKNENDNYDCKCELLWRIFEDNS